MSSDTTRVRNMENTLRMLAPDPLKKPPTAGCPSCKAPLIGTMAFRGAEFICLECGRTCGWLDPFALDADAVEERMAALQAEWDEHAGGKLLYGWRKGCAECAGMPPGGHRAHASEEEIQADAAAREWIRDRTGRA